jgi:hypothetical protein
MPNLDAFLAIDRAEEKPVRLVTGTITAWTGVSHIVHVYDLDIDNPAYEVGASYTAGDTVFLLKYATQYVIIFKITRL